jgi:hypothetical protein
MKLTAAAGERAFSLNRGRASAAPCSGRGERMTYSLTSVGDIIMAGPFIGPPGPRDLVYGVLRNADHCLINLEMPLTLSTEETDKTICL